MQCIGIKQDCLFCPFRVPAFEASQYLITNKEFVRFVEAKGYEKRQYWSDEGWNWKTFRGARHPTFWVCDQGRQKVIVFLLVRSMVCYGNGKGCIHVS